MLLGRVRHGGGSDEPLRVVGLRGVQHLTRGTGLDYATVVHHGDVICEHLDDAEIMADEKT